MAEQQDRDTDVDLADEQLPPASDPQVAGYGYLIFLGAVLTGLAVWFVLTRTSGAG